MTDNWSGIGLAEAIQSACDDPSASHIGGASLELLGAAMDPVGTLAAAGFGWVIEHVEFLREPLDMLCGDPEAIEEEAQRWGSQVHALVEQCERNFRNAAVDASYAWHGESGTKFVSTAAEVSELIHSVDVAASATATRILHAGQLVAAERTFIRDLIGGFIGDVILDLIVASASAVPTAGASVGAAIVDVVTRAVRLAQRIAGRISKLLDELAKIAEACAGLSRLAPAVDSFAQHLSSFAGATTEVAVTALKDGVGPDLFGTFTTAYSIGQAYDDWKDRPAQFTPDTVSPDDLHAIGGDP